MLFSVIVTIYNLEGYLEKCLDSILVQTYEDFEIILVDDGSTDKSGEICDFYQKKDSRITVLHKQNGGLISARVAGLNMASGEYSIFVDADDWIENNELECISEIVNQYHPDMVEFGFFKEYAIESNHRYAAFEEGNYSKKEVWENINQVIKTKPCFCRAIEGALWCKAVKTEILRMVEASLYAEITWGEDVAAIFALLHMVNSVYVTHQPLYHYVVRENSMVHSSRISQIPLIERQINLIWSKFQMKESLAYKSYTLQYMIALEEPGYLFEKYASKLPGANKRIVLFGKGVFAKGVIEECVDMNINVVAVVDSKDVEKIKSIEYDVIFIAITVSSIVEKVIRLLQDMGIESEKVRYFRYEDIMVEQIIN